MMCVRKAIAKFGIPKTSLRSPSVQGAERQFVERVCGKDIQVAMIKNHHLQKKYPLFHIAHQEYLQKKKKNWNQE